MLLIHPAPSELDSKKLKRSSRSTLVSRNITVNGHRTSVRLEPDMWSGLSDICCRERASLHEICSIIASHKLHNTSLTAAIRVFVMKYYRAAATEEGHAKLGHGSLHTLRVNNVESMASMSTKPNSTMIRQTLLSYIADSIAVDQP
jgi:predicted DNA-binding ribbon-helix-helix protein